MRRLPSATLSTSRACEQCLIPRIGSELTGLEDVMILGTQPDGQLCAGTAIDEELHGSAPAVTSGSRITGGPPHAAGGVPP